MDFVEPYRFLLEYHVVNFFKDRLWEAVDKEWIGCLRNENVDNLLQIPSGIVQVIILSSNLVPIIELLLPALKLVLTGSSFRSH